MKQSDIIAPFVKSAQELFKTMLSCEDLQRGKVGFAEKKTNAEPELTGIVGLSGPDRGTIVISFPHSTALAMVSAFMGMQVTEIDADVADAVSEMVNIISGGAKPNLPHTPEEPFELGLPTVVNGQDYMIQAPSDVKWLEIPFSSDMGAFSIRVTFESMKNLTAGTNTKK